MLVGAYEWLGAPSRRGATAPVRGPLLKRPLRSHAPLDSPLVVVDTLGRACSLSLPARVCTCALRSGTTFLPARNLAYIVVLAQLCAVGQATPLGQWAADAIAIRVDTRV